MNRRTAASAVATLAAGAALALLPAQAAQAHPLGNFTVNQYDGLVVAPGRLDVDHVEDLAEIPAAQQRKRIDADGNDRLAPAELSAWARTRCDGAARDARVEAGGGRAVPLSVGESRAQAFPGQAGLQTLRVTCELTAPLPRDEETRLSYRPADAATGPGWREITARGDRMTLLASDVPGKSVSRRLTAYPGDLLSSPPELRSAGFTARGGGPALAGGEDEKNGSPTAGVLPRGADRWAQALTALVARHELTVGFAALALGASLVLGAMHALAPGHGKTMMAAAATAGGRSSLRDVLTLGASVTLTHTLGVFVLGALITAGSAAAPTVVSWLGIASGTLVAGAGAMLLRGAWRRRHDAHGHSHGHSHSHSRDAGHGHGHRHGHEQVHGHGPGHTHGHGQGHVHSHNHPHASGHAEEAGATYSEERAPSERPKASRSWPDLLPVLVAAHLGEHRTEGHAPALTLVHAGDLLPERPAARTRPEPHHHSHVPPAPGLRGVVLLGFAGGLVPSPSAVVVLVGAAALGQAWFGFLLVLAYGAGLALTLTGAGFAAVRLRESTTRRLARRPGRRLFTLAHRLTPFGTAAVVFVLGCGLLLKGAAATLG
ncbi:sulfite exporter TauE/SafE family protein [Streptomyces sp. H27-C3]|uniref:urease accessory protein UreH domain-containing protein n=1 Tax=Streptomyces sp. H27-C3 TaxID=3046305 RepID=UPI0024BA3C1D|nr:sulfite exporter TauE/SafE family protein [Streptomyces sp. H27-C3]MDJ0462486.1 sulfite exporter TauE/SafE family protein [Streptomyces sp. H27-C3]